MQLFKKQCTRPGKEKYVDLTLEWTHEGKTFKVRVQPCFNKDFKYLLAHATPKE